MRSLRHMSLATRIGLLFAVFVASVYGISGFHLYQSLSQQLRERDDATLLMAIDMLRHQLEEFEGVDAVRSDPHRLLDFVIGHKGMFLTIRDSEGALLVASPKSGALSPGDPPVAENHNPDIVTIRDWQSHDGKRGRVLSVWAKVGKESDSRVLLIVAREDQKETAAGLRAHLEDLLWTILIGAFTTAIFGYIIARRGLQSLRAVAKTASEITASQLGERLRVEDAPLELKEMVHAFNRMLDRLEDSFRRLTQFSSDIAHDLRTPISNLMIETQVVLAQRRSISEYEALLAANIEEYERLTRMLENMLFLARAENAQVALHSDSISASVELKRIAEYFEGMADEMGVTVDIDASGTLVADAILFRRAVSNLVANAIRHTPSGGHVTIRGHEQAPDKFVVGVSNPGSGIAPEHLSKIFDRFYRVDDSRGESQSSSGLGLAIVKSIVTLHGGSVRVESIPNNLTTFSLVFPRG